MTDEQEIYREGNLTVSVTPDGIKVLVVNLSWVGGQGHRSVVPWADVLKHAPIPAITESLRGRPGVEIEDLGDAWHEFNITTPTTAIFVPKDGAQ